jgi:hypothetical protein
MERRMRKLRLDVDALVVESFDTDAAAAAFGTVRGNADADVWKTSPNTCEPIETCTCGEACVPPPPPSNTCPPPSNTCPPPWSYNDTCCMATYGPCTCEPIETCSCGAVVYP